MQVCIAIASSLVSAGCATRISAVRPVPPEREAEVNNVIAGKKAMPTIDGQLRAVSGKDVLLAGSSVRFLELDRATLGRTPSPRE